MAAAASEAQLDEHTKVMLTSWIWQGVLMTVRTRAHPLRGSVPVTKAKDLHGEHTSHTSHCPSAVDQLALLEALEVRGVLAQAQRVKAK